MKKLQIILIPLLALCFSATAFAHQPKLENSNQITVTDPEISKAYYATLNAEPDVYTIQSDTPFILYVSLLVPDLPNQTKDIKMEIAKDSAEENSEILFTYDGTGFEWTKFFEEFGHDSYWNGPEFEQEVSPGTYRVTVSSPVNGAKYSLATGKIEYFGFWDTINTYKTIPNLKRNFFEKSPIDFIYSPLGWGLILIMFFLSFVFGFIFRLIIQKIAKNSTRKRHKNLDTADRLIRLGLAIILLAFTISTSWNPILLFFSGFMLFEAIFSWCGLYAALGKNSCPI